MRVRAKIIWASVSMLLLFAGTILSTACAVSDEIAAPTRETAPVTDTATPITTTDENGAASLSNTPTVQDGQTSTGGSEAAIPPDSTTPPPDTSMTLSDTSTNLSDTNTAPSDTQVPESATVEGLEPLVLPKTTAVYFRTRGGSSSDTLKTIVESSTGEMLGSEYINIESSSSALVVFSPETGEATVFETYSSPSWAKNTKRALTIDDNLYLETEWASGRLDLVEYNTTTLARGSESERALLEAAIISDIHYYYDYPEYRDMLGYYGYLEFVKEPLSGGEGTQLKLRPPDAYRDDPDFPFALVAEGQKLYGIKNPVSDGDPVVIYDVNPSTGEPTRLATLPIGDFERGYFFNPRLDNGTVYWAPVREEGSATIIQLWSYRLGDPPSGLKTTDLRVPVGGRKAQVFGFDVDDGHFVWPVRPAGGQTHQLMFYDQQTGAISMADPGLVVNEVQIIHFGEGDAAKRATTSASSAAIVEATPAPTEIPRSQGSTPTAPTPTLAMTPLPKPDASAFELEVGVTPDDFTVVNFCRSESEGRNICVREQRELDAMPGEVYTDDAWAAIRFSLKLAQRLSHKYAGPEHLLYGLVGWNEGPVAGLLRESGADPAAVAGRLQTALLEMPWVSASSRELYPEVGPVLTPVAIEGAKAQAEILNADRIGQEHLLLAMFDAEDSSSSRILSDMGITRGQLWQILSQ